jgi:hypothetical protein
MAICAMIIWACDWRFHGQMDDIWCRKRQWACPFKSKIYMKGLTEVNVTAIVLDG